MFFKSKNTARSKTAGDSFSRLRSGIIGSGQILDGPFGPRKLMYADYVASGRSYGPIEDIIHKHVLPLYANTHTEASSTGRQSSAFREQARGIIAKAIGANEQEAVIFCGSGCTGAIDRLIQILGLKLPEGLRAYGLDTKIAADKRPVVFIGPFEHHSNDVQWRETIADVITIAETEDGLLDMDDLERQLQAHKDRPLLIGSFSTASNVTGIRTDPIPIAKLLHRFGAMAAFDFAASAPYVSINMNEPDGGHFDAIYISPHKFVGGPGSPGILVLKKQWAHNKIPAVPGGGTVSYVSPCAQSYLSDIIHREEGGTPDIIGSIRAGLAFDLKERMGSKTIASAENHHTELALKRWGAHPNIQILGSLTAPRLPIFSFLVRHGEKYLHYNFVVALLDDLFGIQVRGGCSCAGPYGHRLLDIDLETSRQYEAHIKQGFEVLKPGWARVGFNYFFSDSEAELLLTAVEWIADNGHQLLPFYEFNSRSGQWLHSKRKSEQLSDLLNPHQMHSKSMEKMAPKTIKDIIGAANSQIEQAKKLPAKPACHDLQDVPEHLKWFAQSP